MWHATDSLTQNSEHPLECRLFGIPIYSNALQMVSSFSKLQAIHNILKILKIWQSIKYFTSHKKERARKQEKVQEKERE